MTTIETETTDLTHSGATYRGRIWTVPALQPWSGDTSTDADTYRTRNAAKTRRVRTWMGMRYANQQRWKPPVIDNSTGVIDCSVWPNVPWQQSSLEGGTSGRPEWGLANGDYLWSGYPGGNVTEDENICTLNLWMPEGAGPFPLFVWFHGGAWTVNSAIAYQTLGHRLALKGIAVASVEYPLSNFGWFYDDDATLEPTWDGPDFALQCQKAALQWLNDRKTSFGFDDITIGGTSAGGAAVLAMMEDSTTWGLFDNVWSTCGGGAGKRWGAEPNENNAGYRKLWSGYKQAITSTAPYIQDISTPSRTLEDAISADGYMSAVRNGLHPLTVQALSDARNRIKGWGGNLFYSYTGSRNVFPLKDGVTLSYDSSMEAFANDDVANKPMVISTAGNEASLVGYTTEASAPSLNPYEYARLLGYNGSIELFSETFMSSLDGPEQIRRAYNDSIFGFPAYYQAYKHSDNGNNAYLVNFNYKSDGNGAPYANHSTDRHMGIFGNLEWGVGLSGSEAKIYVDDLLFADGYMQLVANFCNSGNPNTEYSFAGDFSLFDTPAGFSLAAFDTTNKTWNVAGKFSATNATDAPPTVTQHTDFRVSAFDAYFNRRG